MRERKWNGRLLLFWSVVLLGVMSGMLFALRALVRMQPPRVAAPDIAIVPPPVEEAPGEPAGTGTPTASAAVNEADAPADGRLEPDRDYIDGDGTDSCPVDYPIKANQRSGIYHMPGDLAYDRTVPTYCYQSEASAERDGYRHAYR